MTSEPTLDIVLPCYNPVFGWEENVLQSYRMITELLGKATVGIILVNDGSTLGITKDHVDKLNSKIEWFTYLSYNENKGKGFAIRTGVAQSKADFQVYTDIDFPYEEKHIKEIYELLRNTCDIVVPVRDSAYYKNVPKVRTVISKILKLIIKLFLSLPTADTQAGLKGFNQAGKAIFLKTTINRYLFDLEFIYMASRERAINIYSLPIRLKNGVVFSHMRWPVLTKESMNFIKILFG